MKKLVVLIIFVFGLVLCSCSGGIKNTSGVIDCYSISVKDGGSTVFNQYYSISYAKVYEYKNSDGESIYTSYRIKYQDVSDEKDSLIRVYTSRYTSDYQDYKYAGFVGYLTVENNYYLDLDTKTIDSEIKYSEYLYSKNPGEENGDNKKAYECAKNCYYVLTSYTQNSYYNLKMDLEENGLERHIYTKLSDSSVITYKVKEA